LLAFWQLRRQHSHAGQLRASNAFWGTKFIHSRSWRIDFSCS